MILDQLSHAGEYSSENPYMKKAFELLKTTDFSALPLGKTEVMGEKLFINVLEADTLPERDKLFEFHRQYADIHVMLDGAEKILIGDVDALAVTQPYKTDIGFGTMTPQVIMDLVPGWFCVCFAQDAHLVGAISTAPQARADHRMKKAVIKVWLGEND